MPSSNLPSPKIHVPSFDVPWDQLGKSLKHIVPECALFDARSLPIAWIYRMRERLKYQGNKDGKGIGDELIRSVCGKCVFLEACEDETRINRSAGETEGLLAKLRRRGVLTPSVIRKGKARR